MAAPEAGNRLAEWPARRRPRQRCRRGIYAPQAIPRVGAGHARRAAQTAPDAGPPPPGALAAFCSDATPARGDGALDQTGSVAGAVQTAQGRRSFAILLRQRAPALARTADPQGAPPEDVGSVAPPPAADQGQTLPLHA